MPRREELAAEKTGAVYPAVSTQFAATRSRLPVLTALVTEVHDTDPPSRCGGNPTTAELTLAHRIGMLQGTLPARPAGHSTTPAPFKGDLGTKLAEEQHQQSTNKARQKQAETASELAAATVTSMLDLVSVGHAEALGIVHEYLDGLAESPLGKVVLSWARLAVIRFAPRNRRRRSTPSNPTPTHRRTPPGPTCSRPNWTRTPAYHRSRRWTAARSRWMRPSRPWCTARARRPVTTRPQLRGLHAGTG